MKNYELTILITLMNFPIKTMSFLSKINFQNNVPTYNCNEQVNKVYKKEHKYH